MLRSARSELFSRLRSEPDNQQLADASGLSPAKVEALMGLLAGSISRPIPDLARELREAGLEVHDEQRWLLGGLAVITAARKP